MNTRREFLAAGGALAALSILPMAKADQPQESKDDQPPALSIYLHGMVWNRDLATPMNDWLIRLDANAEIPIGDAPPPAIPGFATLGDDFHSGVGSHVQFEAATLQRNQLKITGVITESNNAGLAGQSVLIEGKVTDTSVQGLIVTIGGSVFNGAGIIAILIGLLLPAKSGK